MRQSKLFRNTLLIAGVTLISFACSDDNSDNGSQATFRGTVQTSEFNMSSFDKTGDTSISDSHQSGKSDVYAARVMNNGEVEKIDETETQTDDQGRYTIAVDMTAAQRIVIVAQNSGQTLRSFVAAGVENGKTYAMKPISAETSAETDIYLQVVKSGKTNSVSKADIELAVDQSAGAQLHANPSAAVQVAAALAKAGEARAQFYSAKLQSNANAKLKEAMDLHAKAQVEYESRISGNSSVSEREAAMEAFMDASLNAYAETGLETADASTLVDLWVRMTMSGLNNTSSQVKNRVHVRLAFFRALVLDKSVRAQAEAAGFAQSTKQAIQEAGVKLKVAINTTVSTTAEIEAAFGDWKTEIEEAIENDTSVEAEVIISLNTEINSATGASTAFHTAVNASVSTSVVTAAYVTFSNAVKELMRARITNGSEAKVEAATNMLVTMNF